MAHLSRLPSAPKTGSLVRRRNREGLCLFLRGCEEDPCERRFGRDPERTLSLCGPSGHLWKAAQHDDARTGSNLQVETSPNGLSSIWMVTTKNDLDIDISIPDYADP